MHFFLQSIRSLARYRPEWRFMVIGSIAFPQLCDIQLANVDLIYWDDDRFAKNLFSWGKFVAKQFNKEMDAGFLIQSRLEAVGINWGNRERVQKALSECDLIWVPFYNIGLKNLALAELLRRISRPVIATVHDIHPSFYPEDYSPDLLINYQQGFIPFVKNCVKVFTHSDFQKKAIVQHLNLDAAKIYVTPQPPLNDPEVFSCAAQKNIGQKILAKFQIESPFVFYPASTLHAHKNHFRLILAWKELKEKLRDQCPRLVCTSKGSSAQWKRIQALINHFQLGDTIIFTGSIDFTALAVLFGACDLVVLPTLFEGAGSGILTDACIHGKPVISSSIPQIQEQVTALGGLDVGYFDGYSIPSIVETVSTYLAHKDGLSGKALRNQSILTDNFHILWDNWSRAYTEVFHDVAKNF